MSTQYRKTLLNLESRFLVETLKDMRICVNEILKKYIFSSGFDEEQDAKDACKPLCDAIDYEVTEVRVCYIPYVG